MYLKVVSNDDANKLSELLKDGDWMVLYYAEWCGHCNAMKPEWEKVVDKLKSSGKINIADVKSDVIESLLHKPKIEGFPTIKMYNKGREVAKFEDERSAEKLEKFAMSNSKPKKTMINADLSRLEPASEPVVVLDNNTNNLNNLNKKSISQLKDELLMNHRKTKMSKQIANTLNNNVIVINNENEDVSKSNSFKKPDENIESLDALLQPPIHSVKSSVKSSAKTRSMKKRQRVNNKKPIKAKKTKVSTKVSTPVLEGLQCSEIRKAKICKTNKNCVYDYNEFICKDKRQSVNVGNSSKKSMRSKKRENKTVSKEDTTREILHELQKSFKKIGNEAKKDSKLLESASRRL